MSRDEIERRAQEFPFVYYLLNGKVDSAKISMNHIKQQMVDFALAIHDAAKEEDAEIANHWETPMGDLIAERIRATKVNRD